MANLINWLEIPVSDINRAKKFYEVVLKAEIRIDDQLTPDFKMGLVNTQEMKLTDVGGALVEGAGYTPGESNTLIYFNANETGGCDEFLKRVRDANGRVTGETMHVSEDIGYCAFFTDSEGNRMAVHSMKK